MTSLRPSSLPKLLRSRWALLVLAIGLTSVVSHRATADTSELAARLAQLRGEVETLAQELSTKSTESKEAVRSLSRQRADLELELQREETRVQKLAATIAKRRAEIQAQKAKSDRHVPLFKESIVKVRSYVEGTLPFRREERLSALDKLDEQYKAGLLTAGRGLARLWSFVEDEFRMTRENGLYKQTVSVDGEERLAEVVRLGMVMMFYKTEADDTGRAVKRDGKWSFDAVDDPDGQRAILELFSSFKKQIRVGYFELPNALPQLSE